MNILHTARTTSSAVKQNGRSQNRWNIFQEDPEKTVQIAGLAFRDENVVRRTAKRPVLDDLDALPFPAWDLVDLERYRTAWDGRQVYFSRIW